MCFTSELTDDYQQITNKCWSWRQSLSPLQLRLCSTNHNLKISHLSLTIRTIHTTLLHYTHPHIPNFNFHSPYFNFTLPTTPPLLFMQYDLISSSPNYFYLFHFHIILMLLRTFQSNFEIHSMYHNEISSFFLYHLHLQE